MEPLAHGANLLAGILKRIDVAFDTVMHAATPGGRSTYRPTDEHIDAVQQLRALEIDVGIAWDGNLRERASALDPDSFAQETMRVESARLQINNKLSRVLDALASALARTGRCTSPIFVLPVDDFDLNPPRCIELLHLLRMVSVPRLFSVICGDIDLAELVSTLKFSGEMRALAAEGGTRFDVTTFARQLTASALRKLLPPGQRIVLDPLTPDETLEFRPPNRSRTLSDLLSAHAFLGAGEAPALYPRPRHLSDLLSDRAYSGREALRLHPRSATDLWHTAQLFQQAPSLGMIARLAREAFGEETTLNSNERSLLLRSIQGLGAESRLRRTGLAVVPESVSPRRFEVGGADGPVLLLRDVRRWGLRVSATAARPEGGGRIVGTTSRNVGNEDDVGQVADASTCSWFILFHDCSVLAKGVAPNSEIVPQSIDVMSCSWGVRRNVSWIAPKWPTFYDADRFHSTYVGLAGVADVPLDEAWLKAVALSVLREPSGVVIDDIIAMSRNSPDYVRDWIETLPAWLAPENGVAQALAEQLLDSAVLRRVWQVGANSTRRQRAKQLTQLVQPEVAHRLGARPRELYDLVRLAPRALAQLGQRAPASPKSGASVPYLRRLRALLSKAASRRVRSLGIDIEDILLNLTKIEDAEVVALQHPINAFENGIFRPTATDGLDVDYPTVLEIAYGSEEPY
jgi:hypothetical protein